MSKLHILTLNWNGVEHLRFLKPGLINNIKKIYDEKNIESIWHVKDNGSNDNSINFLNEKSEINTIVYEIKHNKDNFSQGVNFLFDKTNSNNDDLILLLNNDIMFGKFYKPNSILNMIKLLTLNIGVVGTKLQYMNLPTLQHAGVIFSEQYGKMPYHFRHKEICDENAKKNRYFQAVTAACCLFRASDFKSVGGFNESLFWSFDDIDFCLKIGQTKKIAYCGETDIFHRESASLIKNPVNKMFLNSNVNLFKKTWFGKYEIDHQRYLDDPDYNLIK